MHIVGTCCDYLPVGDNFHTEGLIITNSSTSQNQELSSVGETNFLVAFWKWSFEENPSGN